MYKPPIAGFIDIIMTCALTNTAQANNGIIL